MIHFHDAAQKAVESTGQEKKITWGHIKQELGSLIYKVGKEKRGIRCGFFHGVQQVTALKFEDPADGEAVLKARFAELDALIDSSFRALEDAN